MIKLNLVFILLAFAMTSNGDDRGTKYQTEKSREIQEFCQIDESVHWRSRQIVDGFVNHTETYATVTAFIRGFMQTYPNETMARCVACAVDMPLNPKWDNLLQLRCEEFGL